jgi:predicted transcriptional regulator
MSEERRHKVAELMERHQISRTTLGELANIRQSNVSSYINGTFPMGDEVYSRIMKGLDEFIRSGKIDEKYRRKSEPKVALTKEEKQKLFRERRDWLNDLMDKERITAKLLAEYSNTSSTSIGHYRSGKFAMREYVVDKIKKGVETIIEKNIPRSEIKSKKPKRIDPYIERNIRDFGNVYVNRNTFKHFDLVGHFKKMGITLSVKHCDDGNYILEDMSRVRTVYKGHTKWA